MRYQRVATFATAAQLRDHLDAIEAAIPLDDEVEPGGVLASPVSFVDADAGELMSPNRFAALPMEGWDATSDGRPTDLVRRRWSRIGASGCGLVWGEATAVRPDGRANPNQLVISDDVASLRELLEPGQVCGLQLTHSGRYAKPAPRTAYRHPILDERVGAGDGSVLTDDELRGLVGDYVTAAMTAQRAGFAFVDIKHCHGYLLHELLSAVDRPGAYGGPLDGRTRFLREVTTGIRERCPGLAIAVRLSAFDLVPFTAGPDGTGQPERQAQTDGYRYAFGGDGTGLGVDLTEAHAFCEMLEELGIGLVCVTAGSPYYNPHIQRPAIFPPSDGYGPPEDPLIGVARQIAATAELAAAHPGITFIGSGYSYLQDWTAHAAQAVVASGGAAMVGLGRMLLAYPALAADVLAGRGLDRRAVCRTFSDCTTAPRNGLVSGCYPLDDFYKARPERQRLLEAKRERPVP